MGLIKQMKQDLVVDEARRATDEGRRIFAPRFNTPASHHGMSGAVPGWAEWIEAVEDLGWRLDTWTVSKDEKGRPEAYPLFRRV